MSRRRNGNIIGPFVVLLQIVALVPSYEVLRYAELKPVPYDTLQPTRKQPVADSPAHPPFQPTTPLAPQNLIVPFSSLPRASPPTNSRCCCCGGPSPIPSCRALQRPFRPPEKIRGVLSKPRAILVLYPSRGTLDPHILRDAAAASRQHLPLTSSPPATAPSRSSVEKLNIGCMGRCCVAHQLDHVGTFRRWVRA